MPLADGDPMPEGDVWYRVLTSDKYVTKGRINHAAFQGKSIKQPSADKNRPWNAELSGRLRSFTPSIDDVLAQCLDYCAKLQRTFHGVMFPKEELPGQVIETIELGICYTPIDGGDQAHADLTFTGQVPFVERSPEHDRFIMALSKKFYGLYPDLINLLPGAKVVTATTTADAAVPTPVDSNKTPDQ